MWDDSVCNRGLIVAHIVQTSNNWDPTFRDAYLMKDCSIFRNIFHKVANLTTTASLFQTMYCSPVVLHELKQINLIRKRPDRISNDSLPVIEI